MYKDILLGVGDHENGRLQQSSPLTYRTASGDLHNIIAIDLGGRIVNPIVQEFFTNHVPIDEEYGLKPVHSFPYEFEMRIPPCAPRGSLIVSVGYIHASHKPDFTVYHDNLAVVPVIHLTGENGERSLKIIVIDGKVGFMGGMNIADRYDKGTSWGTWRDTHFKFVGKGVHGLQSVFLIDWYVVSKKLLNDRIYYPAAQIYSDNIMQIATSGPVGQWRTLLQATIFMIANAKKYIFIQTPYFLPTEGLNQALQTAALGGVDVRLMLPKRSDTRSANMASHSFIDEMVKAGVKVYLYKPGFLHSKLVVSDDALTSIGSANMDFRSFEHNFEINAFVYQKEFALQMKRIFTHDMHHCERLIPSRWLKRPLKQRMAESFMRLFSPLL